MTRLFAGLLVLGACSPATVGGEGRPPAGGKPWNGPVLVSWYGEESGSVTASGEPFDPAALTAAHRTLPFGTLVEMAYTRSGGARSLVTVRINDRGPFVDGRSSTAVRSTCRWGRWSPWPAGPGQARRAPAGRRRGRGRLGPTRRQRTTLTSGSRSTLVVFS